MAALPATGSTRTQVSITLRATPPASDPRLAHITPNAVPVHAARHVLTDVQARYGVCVCVLGRWRTVGRPTITYNNCVIE